MPIFKINKNKASQISMTDDRMDTIAINEKGLPVIIEYKRGQDDAIVVQSMFYFDWLKKFGSYPYTQAI